MNSFEQNGRPDTGGKTNSEFQSDAFEARKRDLVDDIGDVLRAMLAKKDSPLASRMVSPGSLVVVECGHGNFRHHHVDGFSRVVQSGCVQNDSARSNKHRYRKNPEEETV